MKKTIIIVAVVCLLASCATKKHHLDAGSFLYNEQVPVELANAAGSETRITVQQGIDWEYSLSPGAAEWLELTNKKEDWLNEMTIRARAANTGLQQRSASIVIRPRESRKDMKPVTIKVTQLSSGDQVASGK